MIDLLAGIKVIDMTHIHAGPLCTYQLGLMGAEIIKVEAPETGDQMRSMGRPGDGSLMSTGFTGQSANKQSIVIDLKSAAGQQTVKRLLERADVVASNMRPGTMDKLGLGVAAIREINRNIVYCAISGYGQNGPRAMRPALDHLMQGESGMFDATGMPEGPAVRVGFAVADASTAVIASSAIAAALFKREKTGNGCYIDVSMLECCLTIMGLNVYGYLETGQVGRRVGPDPLARIGSVGTFETTTNTLLVNGNNYRLFCRLADAVGQPELKDEYPSESFRSNWEELRARFAAIFQQDSAEAWEQRLSEAGVPVGQVRNLAEVFQNPQLGHRSAVTDVAGRKHINAGFQVDGEPSAPSSPAPRLGEHTESVLRSNGFSEVEIRALLDSGAVANQQEI
jgi:crotonobetainyl-CoA:carnitine CoA-transferase CaiB-like acyl-CoA transferase